MKVNVESHGQAVVFSCRGELTGDSLEGLRRAVDHQLVDADVRDLVLDLEEVPFLDSTCLEYLLDLQEQLTERLGQVRLARADENVSKILEVTRLDNAFETFAEVSQAVKTV